MRGAPDKGWGNILGRAGGSRRMPVVVAGCLLKAPPERASAVILAPEALPRWFAGAHDVRADPRWPEAGSTLEWAVGRGGRWRFHARVLENRLPALLRLEVITPSGNSLVTHRFEALPSGGTRYEKEVALAPGRGLAGRLEPWFLRGLVKREVRRAAMLVERGG